MSNAGDNDLVAATLAGDRTAFDELVGRYQGKIYNLALRITGNTDDALDVSQAAFLKAYDNLGRFNPAHRFFSWIYRIGLNEALDVVGRRRRFADLDAEIPAAEAGPEDRMRGRESGRRLGAALGRLTPQYRAVIVLRHLHGLSYNEIAKVVGVPARTVKSRLFTARRELRRQLAAEGVEP